MASGAPAAGCGGGARFFPYAPLGLGGGGAESAPAEWDSAINGTVLPPAQIAAHRESEAAADAMGRFAPGRVSRTDTGRRRQEDGPVGVPGDRGLDK